MHISLPGLLVTESTTEFLLSIFFESKTAVLDSTSACCKDCLSFWPLGLEVGVLSFVVAEAVGGGGDFPCCGSGGRWDGGPGPLSLGPESP